MSDSELTVTACSLCTFVQKAFSVLSEPGTSQEHHTLKIHESVGSTGRGWTQVSVPIQRSLVQFRNLIGSEYFYFNKGQNQYPPFLCSHTAVQ